MATSRLLAVDKTGDVNHVAGISYREQSLVNEPLLQLAQASAGHAQGPEHPRRCGVGSEHRQQKSFGEPRAFEGKDFNRDNNRFTLCG